MKEPNFISTPMLDFFFKQEVENTILDLDNATKTDLTKIFLKDLEFRCRKTEKNEKRPQRNIILDIYGATGSGKSEIGLFIADYILSMNNKKFDINKYIHFTFETLNKELENAEEGDIFMIDEQEETSRFGVGSLRQISEIRDTERIVRAKNINFLWISPDMVFDHNPHYKIKAIKIDVENELNYSIIYDNLNMPRGFIITPRIKNKEILKAYKEYKHSFIDRFIKRDYKDLVKKLEKYYQEFKKVPNFHKFKNDEKRIKIRLTYPNLTLTEVEEILNYINLRLKEEKDEFKK